MRTELLPDGAGRRTLAEAAAAELHQLILTGELPSGTPLRLVDLATRLEMSPMPVREGLRRLEALGLVEIIPHRGAWVRELTIEDLIDTQQTRLALESLALRGAAERFTAEDAQRARAALEEHERCAKAGDIAGARRSHTEFHFAIYRACGSRWLMRSIEPVWQNSERYRFGVAQSVERIDEVQLEHEAMLKACLAHDADAAVLALRRHLDGVTERITAAMSSKDA